MNYDLDDPLGDLLSDGSNDSFFEKPKKSGNEVNKSKPVTPNVSKSKMADLFDLKQDKPVSFDKKEVPKLVRTDSTSFAVKKEVVVPKKEEKPKTPLKINDESLISDLGFDPKKPKGKFNFMDDILGLGPVIKTSEIVKVQPPPRIKPTPKEDLLVPQNSLSRQSTTETVESFVPSVTRRSGRRTSLTPLNDPLGLFSTPVVEEKKLEAEKKPIKKSEILTIKNNPAEAPKSFIEADIQNSQNLSQIMSSYNLETETALSNLKQQENQLIIARQMKSQEQALFEMQKKQQSLINQQELQFNDLLQKQLHRQNLLENNIKSQQERINGFIQILMAQPSGISEEIVKSGDFRNLEARSSNEIQDINLENEVRKLELEKLRLEDLISNVNSNHEKEMVLLEQSYK